jgi:hypothetical protein
MPFLPPPPPPRLFFLILVVVSPLLFIIITFLFFLLMLQVPSVQEALSTASPPVDLPEVAIPQGPPQALLQPMTASGQQEGEEEGVHTPLQKMAHVAARVRKVRAGRLCFAG